MCQHIRHDEKVYFITVEPSKFLIFVVYRIFFVLFTIIYVTDFEFDDILGKITMNNR